MKNRTQSWALSNSFHSISNSSSSSSRRLRGGVGGVDRACVWGGWGVGCGGPVGTILNQSNRHPHLKDNRVPIGA